MSISPSKEDKNSSFRLGVQRLSSTISIASSHREPTQLWAFSIYLANQLTTFFHGSWSVASYPLAIFFGKRKKKHCCKNHCFFLRIRAQRTNTNGSTCTWFVGITVMMILKVNRTVIVADLENKLNGVYVYDSLDHAPK